MAKIKICGDAVVVTSSLKLEDIKKVEKYRPEALCLKGGEDNKDILFILGTTAGFGSINTMGAAFGREARDGSGCAQITMTTTAVEDVAETVADELGAALGYLGKMEQALPAVIAEIDAERAAILASITVE